MVECALSASKLRFSRLLQNMIASVAGNLVLILGIMIGLFTVTGFINRMGAFLLDLGAWNIVAMIFMA